MEVSSTTQTQSSGTTSGTPTTTTPKTDTTTAAADDFSAYIKKALGGDAKTQVSEEELFAALIEQKLHAEDPAAAEFFAAEKAKLSASMAKPDGYVPVEDVAAAALRATVAAGKIDKTKAETINGAAFAGAQLDSNLDALYDDRGGENDPTIAVAQMEAALLALRTSMEKIEKGETTIAPRDLNTPSNQKPSAGGASAAPGTGGSSAMSGSQKLDGSGGFLWKPESDSNGNLVVLLPSDLNDAVSKVEIYSSLPPTEANRLGGSKFSGIANGDRGHYRFEKPGAEYGDNVYVVVTKNDGDTVSWLIEDAAKRND